MLQSSILANINEIPIHFTIIEFEKINRLYIIKDKAICTYRKKTCIKFNIKTKKINSVLTKIKSLNNKK